MQDITKTGDTYEAANPKHCGYALTFINIIHVPFNKRRQNKGRETRIYIHHWYVVVVIFYARGSRASHELRRSESKKAKLKELSNNISERLTGRKPVSEQSERASGYATDLLLGERSEVSGKSGVYYIIYDKGISLSFLA